MTSATIADFSLLFLFFYFKFRELVEPDFFPGTLERLRTAWASKKLAPRLGRRAAPADLRGRERAAHNPIGSPSADLFTPPCGDLSARTPSPPTVTEVFSCAPIVRSTLGLRAPPETDLLVLSRLSPPRQQRLRRYGLWSALTLA